MFSLEPGKTRGNHAHPAKHEIMVPFSGKGVLRIKCPSWPNSKDYEVGDGGVDGAGLRRYYIEPGCSHAIKNTGTRTMYAISYTDRKARKGDTLRGAKHLVLPNVEK